MVGVDRPDIPVRHEVPAPRGTSSPISNLRVSIPLRFPFPRSPHPRARSQRNEGLGVWTGDTNIFC